MIFLHDFERISVTTSSEKQYSAGGYTGDDIIEFAKIFGVTPRGLRRRINNLINSDNEFQQFIYLGKKKPTITLFEFFKMNRNLNQIPFKLKKEFMKIFRKKEKHKI